MKEYSPVTLVLNGETLDTSRQVSVASLKQGNQIVMEEEPDTRF